MLDHAGIKWRVIVVSACFSGSFVDALASQTTLVATAASADRESFGCASGRDFTYFGEALLRDALTADGSLVDAFRAAEAAIGARERREGLKASEPQLYIGARIQAQLDRYFNAR